MLGTSEEGRRLRAFTVDEFARFVELGLIGEDERVELLDGRIVEMTAKGPMHRLVATELYDRLRDAFPGRAVYKEESLWVSPHDLPEPDLAVAVGRNQDYRDRYPRGDETVLVVEVAVTSLDDDRDKALKYARAGVPVYWIVDVGGRRVIAHEAPLADGYARVTVHLEDDSVSVPQTDARWRVSDVVDPR